MLFPSGCGRSHDSYCVQIQVVKGNFNFSYSNGNFMYVSKEFKAIYVCLLYWWVFITAERYMVLSPFYRQGYWGTNILCHLLKVKSLGSGVATQKESQTNQLSVFNKDSQNIYEMKLIKTRLVSSWFLKHNVTNTVS